MSDPEQGVQIREKRTTRFRCPSPSMGVISGGIVKRTATGGERLRRL